MQLSGKQLLENSKFNKDTAFTLEDRDKYKLHGLLPARVETLAEQVLRHYAQYQELTDNLQKSIFLNALHDRNEILFYKLVGEHLAEMLPIIYTPTVGDVVRKYSLELRRPRGLFISYEDRDKMEAILENRVNDDLDMIVVTDSSAILGIGDQGVGGIAISIGKLMVYTAVGGINPHRVLPMVLDVGTDNEEQLNDPNYLGWRHKRLRGQEYDDFIEQFVRTVRKHFPDLLLHWEDFDKNNSLKILNKYRSEMFTFNDDIQGTGGVTVACVLAGMRGIGAKLSEQNVVFLGGGSSAVGIAEQIASAMEEEGLTNAQARNQIWMLNSKGLMTEKSERLNEFQMPFTHQISQVTGWELRDKSKIDLYDVVKNSKATVLIGVSTSAGAFNEEIVKEMAKNCARPIILPLSNPSSKAEGQPEDIIKWTDGKAMVATGSPFAPVIYNGNTYPIAQCNNALVFPALGLGAMAARANRMTDGMIRAASDCLSQHVDTDSEIFALLPSIAEFPALSFVIALAVAEKARAEGVATVANDVDLTQAIRANFWVAAYE
ncbi:MAG: NAD-dependent malic enzyme [Gammaproteobacteria bacterium]|nr:NAD-dependent malic enzyme [Gammaproteobacteria bacterium]